MRFPALHRDYHESVAGQECEAGVSFSSVREWVSVLLLWVYLKKMRLVMHMRLAWGLDGEN